MGWLDTPLSGAYLRLRLLTSVGLVCLSSIYVLLALLAFRYQAIGVSLVELNTKLHPLIQYSEDYWLADLLGDSLAFPVVMFSGYLGQGYYGLSLSLEQPFTWTNFSGMDPDTGLSVQAFALPGLSYLKYPISRQYTFGLHVEF